MKNTEFKMIERRSEFSKLMREAQAAKQCGDWALVRKLQIQLSTLLNTISSGV